MCFEIQDSSDFRKVKRWEYRILHNIPSWVWDSETQEYLYCAINEDYKEYYCLITYCSHKLLNEILLHTVFCLTQSHKTTMEARLTGMSVEIRVTSHICIMSGLGQNFRFSELVGLRNPR
jgi:hypothetical protein